eukprot:1648621-Ditylum_brightwellii.AAC.1
MGKRIGIFCQIKPGQLRDMLGKALESELMVMKVIGSGRNRLYNFSEVVKVAKHTRMDNESG